jgi:1,4-dihydroxy-2-naphthoyl-CoA hydrolase
VESERGTIGASIAQEHHIAKGADMESGQMLAVQPFPRLMGVEVTEAGKTLVRGRLHVRPELCTASHIMHGGAIMAFADTLGATGAFLNLPEGALTTTIESKTNFISPAPEGTTVLAESTPVHIGRRSSVWQTRITREDGKLVALVTQTQMVLT